MSQHELEQFLKQLEYIGREFLFISIVGIAFTLFGFFFHFGSISKTDLYIILTLWAILFIIGFVTGALITYPYKSEE